MGIVSACRYYGGGSNPSQYDDLAVATGGIVTNINETSNYITIMDTIAQNASGRTGYALGKANVKPSTISVYKNGTLIGEGEENGWVYVSTSNTVLLNGTAKPVAGDTVEITYDYTAE